MEKILNIPRNGRKKSSPGAPSILAKIRICNLLEENGLELATRFPIRPTRIQQIWSKEEEEKLISALNLFKGEKFIWTLASCMVKTRSPKQCKSHNQKLYQQECYTRE